MGRGSHTRTLSLWMNGVRVGTWGLAPHTPDTLQYDPNWVQSREGRPLSLSLPFTPGNAPHRGERVRHYFDNLLPDSPDIRARQARRYLARSAEPFDLLAQAGQDCVGALQILPDQASPAGAQVQARPLNGGEKTALLQLDGQWCMPQGATPTTHNRPAR